MARSWHRPGRRRFTPITACPIRCSGGSTSSFSIWFWCWRVWTATEVPPAASARNCSICFAATSTPICVKWEWAISLCQSGCGTLAKHFTADRVPISPHLRHPTPRRSLRRRWRAISFMEGKATDHGGSRATCSPFCANSIPVTVTSYGAAQLPFPSRRLFPMAEAKAQDFIAPWHVPVAVEEVAETGQHFDLVADATVRAAVAKIAGLRDLPRFEASFDVVRRGSGGLQVTGSVSATVGQTCVVTLEPLANEVDESIDLIFEPQTIGHSPNLESQRHSVNLDDPEPLVGGVVDLGALATEFLILGIDPYPRKPDAVFEAPGQ